MAGKTPPACPWYGSVRWVFGQVNSLPRGQIILGKCLLVIDPLLPFWSSLGFGNNGSKLHSSWASGGLVVGDNSSSTITYGGFFRFQSFFLLTLSRGFHEIWRIHREELMPNSKAWEVEQSKQFFERVPGAGLRCWCLVVLPQGATPWVASYFVNTTFSLCQSDNTFISREGSQGRPPRLVPHGATLGATLWVASFSQSGTTVSYPYFL